MTPPHQHLHPQRVRKESKTWKVTSTCFATRLASSKRKTIHLPNFSAEEGCDTRSVCLTEFSRLEFKVFFCFFCWGGSPVRWGCRIRRLHPLKWVILLQWVSGIWPKTIWWWSSSNAGVLGNAENPFIAIPHRPTQAGVVVLYNIWHGFLVRSWGPRVLWQAVTLWLVNSSAIGALGYNRCVTGRRSRNEHHVVKFRQSAENRSRARDTQPIRGVSDELARGCKRWHPLAPGRRYGKKKSSLWVYVSPPISHTPQKHQPFRE